MKNETRSRATVRIEGNTIVSLGEYLYLLRTRSHMSQEALALKAGVNRNLVSRFERDMQNCTLDSVQALFGVFGLVLSVDFRDTEKTVE